jgi:hypothetical protein
MRSLAMLGTGALAALAAICSADVAPMTASGGSVLTSPGVVTTNVAMVEEIVSILVSSAGCRTTARFLLGNTGEATSLEVGFPSGYEGELGSFRARVDGREVGVADRAVAEVAKGLSKAIVRFWKVWPMAFAAGERHDVEVSYQTSRSVSRPVLSLNPELSPWFSGRERSEIEEALERRMVTYVLWTGALWNGPLRRCRIEVAFDGFGTDHVERAVPAGALVEQGRLGWEFRDFKPAGMVMMDYYPRMRSGEVAGYLSALVARHPEDAVLASQVAGHFFQLGKRDAGLAIYRRFVMRWDGRIPPLVFGRQDSETQQFEAAFQLAATLLEEYDRAGAREQARAIAPVIKTMAESLVGGL